MESRGYNFDQVILKHNQGNCSSRSDCDISVKDSKGRVHSSPVILSNMECVQNYKVLSVFNENRWPYVYHRFGGTQEEFLKTTIEEDWYLKSLSVGVQKEDLEFLKSIKKTYGDKILDWLTIDIAFIHNTIHEEYIKEVRKLFPCVYLVAGNFTTPDAVKWLYSLGVDAGKFGISTSLLCRTGAYTGFSSCATDLLDCSETASHLPNPFQLIHDGGVGVLDEIAGESATGDIFKMLNFGATFVMSSSLFRWCSELADDGGNILQYGNSTAHAKGHTRNIEGAVKTFKTNGVSVGTQMQTITENLQSSLSYAGLKTLDNAYLSCGWNVL